MIAAIYARKSTDQSNVADEAKSVSRQVENARAYAVKKGWTIDDRFIFVDDAEEVLRHALTPAVTEARRV